MAARRYKGRRASREVPSEDTVPSVEVYFDLETTGLDTPEITQFAAVGPSDMGDFDRYVKPRKPINAEASGITGLTYSRGQMYLRGQPVDTIPVDQCLREFLEFLGERKVVLVAHYGSKFDVPILRRVAEEFDLLSELRERVVGCLDTLYMFRKRYPHLRDTRDKPYSLKSLVEELLQEEYTSHDALEDSRFLKRLTQKASPHSGLKQACTKKL